MRASAVRLIATVWVASMTAVLPPMAAAAPACAGDACESLTLSDDGCVWKNVDKPSSSLFYKHCSPRYCRRRNLPAGQQGLPALHRPDLPVISELRGVRMRCAGLLKTTAPVTAVATCAPASAARRICRAVVTSRTPRFVAAAPAVAPRSSVKLVKVKPSGGRHTRSPVAHCRCHPG
jgi:hypothetical protein